MAGQYLLFLLLFVAEQYLLFLLLFVAEQYLLFLLLFVAEQYLLFLLFVVAYIPPLPLSFPGPKNRSIMSAIAPSPVTFAAGPYPSSAM